MDDGIQSLFCFISQEMRHIDFFWGAQKIRFKIGFGVVGLPEVAESRGGFFCYFWPFSQNERF